MSKMVAINKFISGGIKEFQYGLYDKDGLMCGAMVNLANGEDSGMAIWRGVKTIDITIPEKDRQWQTGDDTRQGFITFESTENPIMNIQMGIQHLDHEAVFQNTKLHDDTQLVLGLFDPRVEEVPSVCTIIHSTAKQKVYGQPEAASWVVQFFNNGEISVRGRDSITERQLANYDYSMTLSQTSNWPWGQPLTIEHHGTNFATGGTAGSKNPVTMHAVRGDGTVTEVTLDFTPVGVHTVAGAFKVWQRAAATGVWTELEATTHYTVANKTFTFVTTPAAGDHVIIRYLRTGLGV
jgi:hypothetical protein